MSSTRRRLAQIATAFNLKSSDVASSGVDTTGGTKSLWEFDDKITAPWHGFAGALDYYQRSSRCYSGKRQSGFFNNSVGTDFK